MKCVDQNCCKPFRSPILNLLPNRHLPPPQVISNTTGIFKLVNPNNVTQKDHFASFLTATTLRLLSDKTPMDFYCPSQTRKIPDQTCPVCHKYFPNKTHMLRHKRALHKYSRAKLEQEFLATFDEASRHVSFVAGKDGEEYLCVMRDGSIDYQQLPGNHPKVVDFQSLLKTKNSCEVIEDVQAWVSQ